MATVLLCFVDARHSWLLSTAVITVYQLMLSRLGLSEYILDAGRRRVGLFDANREGICSCCGYLALYLAGLQLGRLILTHRSILRYSCLSHVHIAHLIASQLNWTVRTCPAQFS